MNQSTVKLSLCSAFLLLFVFSGICEVWHQTDFLAASVFTHVYAGKSSNDRRNMRRQITNRSYTHFYLYAYNENDYKGPSFDYYSRPDDFKNLLNELLNDGLRPVVWLFPDDADNVHGESESELKARLSQLIPVIDNHVESYVLGLELDEYWGGGKVDALGKHLNSLTDKDIGVHQLNGNWNYGNYGWADYMVLQYGFNKSESFVKNMTQQAINDLNKPVVAGEYAHDNAGGESTAIRLGDAAVSVGASGFGNGGTPRATNLTIYQNANDHIKVNTLQYDKLNTVKVFNVLGKLQGPQFSESDNNKVSNTFIIRWDGLEGQRVIKSTSVK